ncbi:PREDICTED: F-box/FBD/LRR-repeat protein At1g51370-like [Camelina sativa]|uniref:F-box/FBD/LRR-repeat protein At1g51370-like n=1 Tax=Camelina sativa TaxID=90675 RepID=A0ABM0WNW7_CAMSA|nr:PREDICTED: F-box/FBD/LRR-repeat protein At1g51370-like [Camelina sativa]
MVVGRQKTKKTKICDHGKEDLISQLPEPLISEILCRLSTKDAVRTSLLSTSWRNLWRWVPDLDLNSDAFPNFDASVSFVERFLVSHRDRELWIRRLRLSFGYRHHRHICDITSWIDAVTTCRIQHLDFRCCSYHFHYIQIPLSLYTCQTLIHLRLSGVSLCNAEFVSLPCLKFMHLVCNKYPNETTLQKLISGSPILEDLTIYRTSNDDDKATVLQVRSHTLKRVYIDDFTQVVIDAPLLQCLKTSLSSPKNYQIVNLGSSAKLDIGLLYFGRARYSSSMFHDIITDISRVRELVVGNAMWEGIFHYSKSEPVLLQFRHLSRLNVKFIKSGIELLPFFLESCPKLESLVMELVKDLSMRGKEKEPKVMFSTVPRCLVSSLKFVKWKRSISVYEGETELVRYFLKNSQMLEKLRLDIYYTEKAKCAFLQELLTMPRCSSVCEIHCSLIPEDNYR